MLIYEPGKAVHVETGNVVHGRGPQDVPTESHLGYTAENVYAPA